ncbi:MAG: hypothetical protein KIT27_04225 [Legionellales bacterium]|nr:hypothetical protein [Legionellales bacterium]
MQTQPVQLHQQTPWVKMPAWNALYIFNGYRLALAAGLLLIIYFNHDFFPQAINHRQSILILLWVYLSFALLSMVMTVLRRPSFSLQVILPVLFDIFILTMVLHTSRAEIAILGILMNASIAGGSILTEGRTSIFFAAIASLSILFEHAYSLMGGSALDVNYMEVGIVGLTFFATAILGHTLSKKLRATEAIASQQGKDLAYISEINQYIVQQIRSGIMVVNCRQEIEMINHSAQKLLFLTQDALGKPLKAVIPVLADLFSQWQAYRAAPIPPFQLDEHANLISPQFIDVGDEGKGVVIFLDDLSLATQQAQQLKLAALGRLSASIAHEIRNPLGAVSHAAQLLEESSQLTSQDKRLLQIIRQHADRMNQIIKNVLQLSKRSTQDLTAYPLSPWINEFFASYQQTHHPDAIIDIEITEKQLPVYFDLSQLSQILTNLCDNGLRYSYQASGQKRIKIIAGIEKYENYAYIDIIDFGDGIETHQLDHLFEPFFTTEQQGTGLGLYIAKELCEVNHANLKYYDLTTGESCFRIYWSLKDNA